MRRKWAFHGTRAELLPEIARHGLTPEPPTRSGGGGWEGGGIFFSPSPSTAAVYGGSVDIGNAPFAYGVLLKFPWPSGPVEYVGDDTGENAFIARRAVPPKQIEVYSRGVPYDAELLDNLRGPWLPVSEAAKMVGADGYLQPLSMSKPEELSRLVRSQRYDRRRGYRPLVLPGVRELPEELEPNPARTPAELPDDVKVVIAPWQNERQGWVEIFYADEKGRELPPSRDSVDDPSQEENFAGLLELTYREGCDAFEIGWSLASPGWGPLLYDVAMEYASMKASGLMSDRWTVSERACRVWTQYGQRKDVARRPIDPDTEEECAPHGECAASSEIFSKAPTTMEALVAMNKLEVRSTQRDIRDMAAPKKLAANPARSLDDLPDGVRIGVVESFDEDDNRIKTFTVYYADAKGHPLPSSRDSIDDPAPEQFLSGAVRTFYRAPCDAYEVIYSIAAPGWGPLLYDVAIELSSKYGGGLMSDRVAVSDAACRVWSTYRRRSDVRQRPLPERRACAPGAECSTEVAFTKAPDTVNRLERERKILYFDDVPPGAQGVIPLPEPEEAAGHMFAKPLPLSMVANPDEEIHRAAMLLGFMDAQDAYEHLVDEGFAEDDAFLAVQAARVYTREHE